MKKYQLFSFAIALFALLQSCAITTENTYHKDATSSMLMTVDMKEAMGFIKSMGDSDSSKAPVNFSKYAKDWESLYDREKKQALEKGEKPLSVMRRLTALSTLSKNTNPKIADVFKDDAEWIKGTKEYMSRPTAK